MAKAQKTLITGVILIIPVLVLGIANAQNDSGQSLTEAEIQRAIIQRMAARKQKYQNDLNASRQELIQEKCQQAQSLLDEAAGKSKEAGESRERIFRGLLEKINSLVTNLESEGITAAQLKDKAQQLEAKINTFSENLSDHVLAARDLAGVANCEDDPSAFQSTLEESRALMKNAKQNMEDITSFLKNNLKPELINLKESDN